MMTMISINFLIIFILLPSVLSLVYILSVQAFLAAWHECSWTYLAKPMSFRLALVIVAVAVIATSDNDGDKTVNLAAYLAPMIIIPLVSIYSIYRTRILFIQGPVPKFQDMNGKVIIVTGSNTGIGKETAKQLLAMGATVIMACRSEQRARKAMDDVLNSIRETSASERLLFLQCDVSDFDSVRKAVTKFEEMKLPLHVLINNAGIMMGQRKTTTSDDNGLELTMACNHLGHFLLTNLLLPTMRKQEDARVVIVTSSTYVLATDGIDLKDLNCEKRKYTMFSQYAQSKLANILMGKEMVRREKSIISENSKLHPVSVFMVHPGLVRTDIVNNMPWYLKYPNIVFAFLMTTLQKSAAAGAYSSVFCASSDKVKELDGEYFSNSENFPINHHANNFEAAKDLWKLSEEMVGLNTR